jgi:PIN domain nuclease of toxin-antitoxin system
VIVLDTHVWVNWILLGETSLTKPIQAAINSQTSMAVSAISCFEVSLLVKQHKLELPLATTPCA